MQGGEASPGPSRRRRRRTAWRWSVLCEHCKLAATMSARYNVLSEEEWNYRFGCRARCSAGQSVVPPPRSEGVPSVQALVSQLHLATRSLEQPIPIQPTLWSLTRSGFFSCTSCALSRGAIAHGLSFTTIEEALDPVRSPLWACM